METLIEALFALSPDIRYVAVRRGAGLTLRERTGLAGASSAESDRYEELLVNPALLTLTTQRGNIDAGGLRYLLVRYGNFFQLVLPLPDGQVSVALEPHTVEVRLLEPITAVLRDHGLTSPDRQGAPDPTH
jgi:hypothetical protein